MSQKRSQFGVPQADGTYLLAITRGLFARIDEEDLDLQMRWWCAIPMTPGSDKHYAFSASRGAPTQKEGMHQLVAARMGLKPSLHETIDHVDRDPLNNCRSNLRLATKTQNNQNKSMLPQNTSGFKGVSQDAVTLRWRAQIYINRKRHHLGYFATKEEAALAYDEEAKRLFGEFATLNFMLAPIPCAV